MTTNAEWRREILSVHSGIILASILMTTRNTLACFGTQSKNGPERVGIAGNSSQYLHSPIITAVVCLPLDLTLIQYFPRLEIKKHMFYVLVSFYNTICFYSTSTPLALGVLWYLMWYQMMPMICCIIKEIHSHVHTYHSPQVSIFDFFLPYSKTLI